MSPETQLWHHAHLIWFRDIEGVQLLHVAPTGYKHSRPRIFRRVWEPKIVPFQVWEPKIVPFQ